MLSHCEKKGSNSIKSRTKCFFSKGFSHLKKMVLVLTGSSGRRIVEDDAKFVRREKCDEEISTRLTDLLYRFFDFRFLFVVLLFRFQARGFPLGTQLRNNIAIRNKTF